MVSYWTKGMGVWILSFLSFLAGINTLNAVVQWALNGGSWVFKPYLISFIGEMQIVTYFWVSILAMFLFLGLTIIIAYSKPPPDPFILNKIVDIEGELQTNRSLLESTQIGLYQRFEDNENLFKKVNITLRDVREKTVEALEKQEKEIQKVCEDIPLMIKAGLTKDRRKTANMLEKQEKEIQKVVHLSRLGSTTIMKQMAELSTLGTRLERLEKRFLPKPILTSQSRSEEIKGIGPRLGKELRLIGITTAGEFITADPAIISKKTRISPEMTMRLQERAKMLMVPGIEENDVDILEEAGITTRRDLANQDTIELSRKIGEAAKNYVKEGKISDKEKPTIEEVSSWIRLAKF